MLRSVFSVRSLSTVTQNNAGRCFQVTFQDVEFPFVWLRDCSLDPKTYSISDSMQARIPMMKDFDVNVSPTNFEYNQLSLKVTWNDGVQSKFPREWLLSRNLNDSKVKKQRLSTHFKHTLTWNQQSIKKLPKKFDYNKLLNTEKELWHFLESVCVDGIAVITNGLKLDKEGHRNVVREVGRRIGLIHQTHFGEIVQVITKTNASNMAYVSGHELPYHTDFPSLSDPPQLQFLHMAQPAYKGGLSLFVDGFQIAEQVIAINIALLSNQLRSNHFWAFDILSKTKLEFIEVGYDVHEKNGKQFRFDFNMSLNASGDVKKIQFGNAMRSWCIEGDNNEIQKVYDALKLFTELCYLPQNQLKFALEEDPFMLDNSGQWENYIELTGLSCQAGIVVSGLVYF